MSDDKNAKTKIGVARMIGVAPVIYDRNKDWAEGLMKAEIKQKIIERQNGSKL